jgi:actin-related protein
VLWQDCFDQLKVAAENQPLLATDKALNPKANREKTFELAFERFNVPSTYLAIQSALAIYATGHTTAVVVDFGEEEIRTMPMLEGYILPHGYNAVPYGGDNVTRYLKSLLEKRGVLLSENADDANALCEAMKDSYCRVAPTLEEFNRIVESPDGSEITGFSRKVLLPNGSEVEIGKELVQATEGLFQPSLFGISDVWGLPDLTIKGLHSCNLDIRKDVYNTIVITGGTSLLPGLAERLKKGVEDLRYHNTYKVGIVAAPERGIGSWVGGSILGSLTNFHDSLVTRLEYDESGPTIVHRRCF